MAKNRHDPGLVQVERHIAMTTHTLTTIPFAKLRLSEANVRKSNREVRIPSLAASIDAYGLLHPLIVAPAKGKKTLFDVHAGGRRWRAISLLIEEGKLPKDHGVEVKLYEDAEAALREIGLAENLQRENMSAADECRAYQDIVREGTSADEIANRFGVTVRHVEGRLRLADLAEPIFEALAEGEITLDVAMAYGSTSDHARQLAAWRDCSCSWRGNDAQAIRRHIRDSSIAANDPVALFVGEAEYTAAGGRIERDLFAAEGEGVWLDAELARDLANKKLTFEAEVAVLGTKLGWVKPVLATNAPYDETKDLGGYWPRRADPSAEAKARIAEIEDRLEQIELECEELDEADEEAHARVEGEIEALQQEHDRLCDTELFIPDEDRPQVGTFLLLDRAGKPVLCSSYYTTAKTRRGGAAGAKVGSDSSGTPATGIAEARDELPRSLEEQLAKDRRDILALHVATDPALALDLAIFCLARDLAGHFGSDKTGCSIRITDRFEPAGLKDIPESPARVELAGIHNALDANWASEDGDFGSFLAFRELGEDVKAGWLAFAVSQSLRASLAGGTHDNAFQTRLGAHIGIDPAQHWRPGAERFFDRIKKSTILSILGTIDPTMPGRYATAKKGELASAAAKLCAGETIAEPDIKQRALGWMPEVMAFPANGTEGDVHGEDVDGESFETGDDDGNDDGSGEDADEPVDDHAEFGVTTAGEAPPFENDNGFAEAA